jgi:hypothetical protein
VEGFIFLAVVGAVLWIIAFAQLMGMSDAEFPGRYDKVLWVVAFALTFLLAPVAFWVWKYRILARLAAAPQRRPVPPAGGETAITPERP